MHRIDVQSSSSESVLISQQHRRTNLIPVSFLSFVSAPTSSSCSHSSMWNQLNLKTGSRSRTYLAQNRFSPMSSFRNDFSHAASETYLITKLAFILLKYLGIGYRWLTKLAALALYALFLMPGFIQVGYRYFFDKRIHRSIVYGPNPRNRLDIYLPENCNSPKPVVAFVTGGAWIIGYKAWGSLLGLQLVEEGVIVACIDYRNFPQGSVGDMVEDVMQGIRFICENAASYGGDPNRLYLAGQSAGAHLAACALVEQAIKECAVNNTSDQPGTTKGGGKELHWRASQFKAYFGISGGYNLEKLVDHFHNRGLYRGLFLSIMEGEASLSHYSPELRVKSLSTSAQFLLPAIYLFHGTADYSIPSDASTNFADVLASIGVQVKTKLYKGKTHTDVFLQNPMRGGYDALLQDILDVIQLGSQGKVNDAGGRGRRRLVPEILLQLARSISPF